VELDIPTFQGFPGTRIVAFAKACRGDSTKDVTASAAAQLKQIYKAKYSSTRPSRLRRRR